MNYKVSISHGYCKIIVGIFETYFDETYNRIISKKNFLSNTLFNVKSNFIKKTFNIYYVSYALKFLAKTLAINLSYILHLLSFNHCIYILAT